MNWNPPKNALHVCASMSGEMDHIDAMEPTRRALVHEYGYEIVKNLLQMVGDDVDDHTLAGLCERERKRRAP